MKNQIKNMPNSGVSIPVPNPTYKREYECNDQLITIEITSHPNSVFVAECYVNTKLIKEYQRKEPLITFINYVESSINYYCNLGYFESDGLDFTMSSCYYTT